MSFSIEWHGTSMAVRLKGLAAVEAGNATLQKARISLYHPELHSLLPSGLDSVKEFLVDDGIVPSRVSLTVVLDQSQMEGATEQIS